jgi:hypothetical protein
MIRAIFGLISKFCWFAFTVAPVLMGAILYDSFEIDGKWWELWRIRRIEGGRIVREAKIQLSIDKEKLDKSK